MKPDLKPAWMGRHRSVSTAARNFSCGAPPEHPSDPLKHRTSSREFVKLVHLCAHVCSASELSTALSQ